MKHPHGFSAVRTAACSLPALPLRAVILQGTGRLQGFIGTGPHPWSVGVLSGQYLAP